MNFTLANMSSPHQTGVQDYETFNDQLDSLSCWIVEAEEALRAQDPNGCTDLTVIQDRMEELKVVLFIRELKKSISLTVLEFRNVYFLLSSCRSSC